MKPRMPNSPPAVPTMARSRMISGAMVSVSPRAGSAIMRSQATSPCALRMANMRPSSAIEITLSFHSATPRLLTPQQATSPRPGAIYAGGHLPFDDALLSCGDIDRIDRVPAIGHVHDAVLDQRGRFQVAVGVAAAVMESTQRHREHRFEVLDGI